MARGDMPSEEQLRTIAAGTPDEQAQVWKKYKPRKNEQTQWYSVTNALSKRRIPFSAAKFDDELAEKYGVRWIEDLFAPAGDDGRHTTNVEGFFGAQQEWLQSNLPERGVLVPQDEYGHPTLPRKAEHIYGKPSKHDMTGHYLDPRSGEVRTITYRMPAEKKSNKAGKGAAPEIPETPSPKRPDVTQKGNAIIGDLRTDALHEALRQNEIADTTLVALLVLAFGGRNVSVQSGSNEGKLDREDIAYALAEGGVLTADHNAIRTAAREMLVRVLSCRDNASNSGVIARVAGESVGATALLPSMATEEFLSCLSRQALEREAAAKGVRIEVRLKDTRSRMIEHFAGTTWHYPAAAFALAEEEIQDLSIDPVQDDVGAEDPDNNMPTDPDHGSNEPHENDGDAASLRDAAD
jgi:ParB family chromosome partitioning protein